MCVCVLKGEKVVNVCVCVCIRVCIYVCVCVLKGERVVNVCVSAVCKYCKKYGLESTCLQTTVPYLKVRRTVPYSRTVLMLIRNTK